MTEKDLFENPENIFNEENSGSNSTGNFGLKK